VCGIVGILSFDENRVVSGSEIVKMRDKMMPRGPDDAGIYLHKWMGFSLGLGHRRLSILDLSPKGRQPMSTADDTLWIVFNGEIFNFKELRKQLMSTGKYVFVSQSDTEVLLYAIKEWGLEGCLRNIRGMYAFAFFNKIEQSLTLVRDPLGVKPLYYYKDKNLIAFASEIKAILAMPGVEKCLNEETLYHYLTFANAPAPDTFFKNIYKLEAGSYIKIGVDGKIQKVRYWDPTRFQPLGRSLDEQEYIHEIKRLLRQSVARRMVSDVPFGVFLSGGVDSSLNVALMSEQMDRPVETFSVGIKGDPSNELHYARKLARHFGANYHEIIIDEKDFIDFLPEMAYLQDEPLADPVCVPLYYVSKLARESGTIVIQVGEGSDEIFAGYKMYHLFNKSNRFVYHPFSKLPSALKCSLYRHLGHILPPWIEDILMRACHNDPLFLGNAIAFWDTEKHHALRNGHFMGSSSSFIKELTTELPSMDSLLTIINIELKNRLPELLLMRVDKMSMANSIETRVPYLDEDLVEFGLTIPSYWKHKNGEAKYILKKTAEDFLPREIIYRKKWGFCGSSTNMVSKGIANYAHKKIMKSRLIKELFNRDYISEVFKNYERSKRLNSFKIWNLLNLVLWHECWFE